MTSDGHALEKGLEVHQSGNDDVATLSLMIAISVMIKMMIISLRGDWRIIKQVTMATLAIMMN